MKVTSNAAKLHVVDTFDHISYFDDNALWKIEALGTGYTLQNCGVTTSKQCLRPSGTDVVTSTFVSGNGAFTWTLTPNTIVPDLLILLDKDTARPINGSFHTLYEGDTATLDDLNLMVSYVSQTKNEVDYYWQSSDSSVAYVNANDEIVVCGRGETTISLHVSSSTNTPMYLIIHSPYVDDGTYYIRNWHTNLYVRTSLLSGSSCIYCKTFTGEQAQLWNVTYLGNREYSIQSIQSPGLYLGIKDDSFSQGALIELRSGPLTSGMKWRFTQAESGAIKISAQCAPNLFVKVSTSVGEDNIRQYAYEDSTDQYSEWLFCEYSNQVKHELQTEDNWCWVTCARMASFKYMKSPISQEAAAYYTEYEQWMDQYGLPLTLYPEMEKSNPAFRSDSAAEVSQALEYILGWEGCTYYNESRVYSEYRLRSLLDDGNVIIAGRSLSDGDGDGHVYLICDYSFNTTLNSYQYHIYDPWYSDERSSIIRTYDWIYNGNDAHYSNHRDGRVWKWIVTYRIGSYALTIPAPEG